MSAPENKLLAAALKYAERGIPVFPLHSICDGRCTCGMAECKSVGKHPRTATGFKEASLDTQQIEAWWRTWPDANIGGQTGIESGLAVLDVDPRHRGDETLAALESVHGTLPNTRRARTGGGGAHVFFRRPESGLRCKTGIAPGLDFKADGGYVLLAPSLHASGNRYAWESGSDLAQIPEWLAALVKGDRGTSLRVPPRDVQSLAYAEAAMKSECAIVAGAPEGNRHHPLLIAALKLGRFVPAPLAREVVERRLIEAATESGHLSKDGLSATLRAIGDGLRYAGITGTSSLANRETPKRTPASKPDRTILRRFSEIESREVEWLWPGYIPFGAISMLDGDPGLGKSTLALDLAARLSRGERMPDGSGGGVPVGSIILTTEDDLHRVVRPRLAAAGANLSHVGNVTISEPDAERDVSVCRDDLESLAARVKEIGARLLILDPLVAMLPPDVNANNDQHVRQALRPLRDFAEAHGIAVLCLRHLRKSGADQAVHRGGGSIGIIGAARAGLLVGKDPSDSTGTRKVFAVQKMNLGPIATSLAFDLETAPGASVARLRWQGESTVSADELVSVGNSSESRTALAEAQEWLGDVLSAGSKSQRDIESDAHRAGHSPKTLRRAFKALGGRAEKVGAPGEHGQHWRWSLPPEDAQSGPKVANADVGHLRASSPPARPSPHESGLPAGTQEALLNSWEVPPYGGAR